MILLIHTMVFNIRADFTRREAEGEGGGGEVKEGPKSGRREMGGEGRGYKYQ